MREQFRDLEIGAVFVFSSEVDDRFKASGIARGPWVKISPRKYHHQETGLVCRIGTIKAFVRRITR